MLTTRHLKKISENFFIKCRTWRHNVKNTDNRSYLFCLKSVCLNIFFRKLMYAMPIQVHTKVHFYILQFLVVTYDMFFLRLCYRRCLNGIGLFSLFKQFLETEIT